MCSPELRHDPSYGKGSASGIHLSNETRANCLSCAQGKQTKYPQSRKDTVKNMPIIVIGGFICFDLKGPMTPHDILRNLCMVKLSNRLMNYCRVFLAKSKDVTDHKFE